MDEKLKALLQECVVKLSIPEFQRYGTGFFVSPGIILTCAHVVEDRAHQDFYKGEIDVRWKEEEAFVKARVKECGHDKQIDIALLTFSSDAADNPPCVLLEGDIEADDKLSTFGYPDDFTNGRTVTFTNEGPTGDTPPLYSFKYGNIRRGMSGSPVLNYRTGSVTGMVKETLGRNDLRGGLCISAAVILKHFSELIELQKKFHEQNNRWNLARKGQDDKSITIQDLKDKVINELSGILEDSRLKTLKECLGDILGKNTKKVFRTSDEIASQLLEIELLAVLSLIYIAMKEAASKMKKKGIGRGENAVGHIWKGSLDIVGWLVLLAVNEDWLSKNSKDQPQKIPSGAIELMVKTDSGIEILHAALNKTCAQFELAESNLFGANRIPAIGQNFLETGFCTDDAVLEIKKVLYAYITRGWGKERFPNESTHDLDKKLNAQLEWWNSINDKRYLVVNRSEANHPLNNKEVQEKLLNDLPGLRVIFHNPGEDSDAFIVSEIELDVRLINFFATKEEL